MLRLWLSAHGEAPPSRGLRVPAPHDSPVQAINPKDEIVKVSRVEDCKATCCRFHVVCFARDPGSQQLAREVSPEKTDEILAAIARKAAEAAVPSPLSFIRLPRAWLSLMPCACMYRCSETLSTLFCAQLARFAIAQCRSWLVAKITLVVSIVPQVAASLANAKPAEKRKAPHGDRKGGGKKPCNGSEVCIPASGGTHPAGAHTFACVRSRCTRAEPRTHTHTCAPARTRTPLCVHALNTRGAPATPADVCACACRGASACVRLWLKRLTDGCRLHFSLGECVCARVCEWVMLHPRLRHPEPARPSSAPSQVCRHRNSRTAPG
jgi:hypothetical protein